MAKAPVCVVTGRSQCWSGHAPCVGARTIRAWPAQGSPANVARAPAPVAHPPTLAEVDEFPDPPLPDCHHMPWTAKRWLQTLGLGLHAQFRATAQRACRAAVPGSSGLARIATTKTGGRRRQWLALASPASLTLQRRDAIVYSNDPATGATAGSALCTTPNSRDRRLAGGPGQPPWLRLFGRARLATIVSTFVGLLDNRLVRGRNYVLWQGTGCVICYHHPKGLRYFSGDRCPEDVGLGP
jgi:hypothetical protein